MVQRFVTSNGLISIATGASVVTGIGTTFAGKDRAGSEVVAIVAGGAAIRVGVVAEVEPEGVYSNLSLPIVSPYRGPPLVNVEYELTDGPAINDAATQAAILARFSGDISRNFGLVGNTADDLDYTLVHNNSLIVDEVTSTIYLWRDGVLSVVRVIGDQWKPKGLHSMVATYAINDMVQAGNFVFVSNINGNTGNAPNTAPASTAQWTCVPLPTVQQVLNELGIHKITVSTNFPAGGADGDLWFKVS